jgi:hypothetical protein
VVQHAIFTALLLSKVAWQKWHVQVLADCLCTDNTMGPFCNLDSSGCSLDINRKCCSNDRALAVTGTCCASTEALDADSECCALSQLDVCGVCGGNGLFVDALGTCCPVSTADACRRLRCVLHVVSHCISCSLTCHGAQLHQGQLRACAELRDLVTS